LPLLFTAPKEEEHVKTNHSSHALDARLSAAASFVRHGDSVVDVGTDHAYLPIWLCQNNLVSRALATDVREGPIQAAQRNIHAAGLSGIIETRLCDGLDGSEPFHPDTILICGMGGDLIAAILSAAPWLTTYPVRLVLQPMTHAETVRAWLAQNGFAITDETLAQADKIYQIICADYVGTPYTLGIPESHYGPVIVKRGGPLWNALAAQQEPIWRKKRDARASNGLPTSEEDEMLAFFAAQKTQ